MVSISYKLVGVGWSECVIQIDGQQVRITASYLSDALDDLLLAMIALLQGSQRTKASFDEEPGEYRWIFTPLSGGMLSVQILEFPELWSDAPDEEGVIIFNATCRLRTFVGAVLSASQKILNEYGVEGYRQRWGEHGFPSEHQKKLKSLLEKGRKIKSEHGSLT